MAIYTWNSKQHSSHAPQGANPLVKVDDDELLINGTEHVPANEVFDRALHQERLMVLVAELKAEFEALK